MIIRNATPEDKPILCALYKEVAQTSQGIARLEHEITDAYVDNLYQQIATQGLMFVAVEPTTGLVIAEMHASTYGIQIFSHILTNLTIVVKPSYQGKGVGKRLFSAFLQEIDTNWPEIGRIELESRSSNQKSIGLYKSLGFVHEGTMKNKTHNADGGYEDSLLFARLKPNFDFSGR